MGLAMINTIRSVLTHRSPFHCFCFSRQVTKRMMRKLNMYTCWSLFYLPTPGTCGSSWILTWTWGLGSTQAPCCVVCWACKSGSLTSGPGTWASPTCWRPGAYQGEGSLLVPATSRVALWCLPGLLRIFMLCFLNPAVIPQSHIVQI